MNVAAGCLIFLIFIFVAYNLGYDQGVHDCKEEMRLKHLTKIMGEENGKPS